LLKKKKIKKAINSKNKPTDIYEDISKQYCKHKVLMSHYKDNPSLRIFIEEIQKKVSH